MTNSESPCFPIAQQKAKQQVSRLRWYLPDESKKLSNPRDALAIIEKNLTQDELDITVLTATELVHALAQGKLSSLQVTEAFCKRASFATQLLNCCTEIMFEDALERAKYLDEYLQKHKKPIGPLHGLPVSIKDAFDYKGVDTTTGWTALANQPAASHSPIVKMLLELGAVLYVKTNIPATMMTADSSNIIFGQTKNPHNLELTAGGSSGGEGSLIAALGSPLGIGSDIAGSIRMPSLCCGTYGLRPSINRFPIEGHLLPLVPGSDLMIHGVAGPMANSVQDLKLLMSSFLGLKPWKYDVTLYPLEYRSLTPPTKLRVGVLRDNGLVKPHPPVLRGIDLTVQKLRQAGHEVFEVQSFPSLGKLHEVCFGSYSIDGFKVSRKYHDDMNEEYIKSFYTLKYDQMKGPSSLEELFELNNAMHELQFAMNRWWHETFENEFDVLLCPAAPHVAVKHDMYSNFQYTMLWNCVDYPAGVIPVGKVDKSIDVADPSYESRNEEDAENYSKYDPELMDGAPICVQIVGQKMREEELLEAMSIIDKAIHS